MRRMPSRAGISSKSSEFETQRTQGTQRNQPISPQRSLRSLRFKRISYSSCLLLLATGAFLRILLLGDVGLAADRLEGRRLLGVHRRVVLPLGGHVRPGE